MFIGKWNKSVVLTYLGLVFSVCGIYVCFAFENKTWISMCCLVLAGLCDVFDGFVARKCKRTEEEKQFGIQLDSLVDVIDFIALPMVIFLGMNMTRWYQLIILIIFGICGVARLAYFNIKSADADSGANCYRGLPVTFSAAVFPIAYLLKKILSENAFLNTYTVIVLLVAVLFISNFPLKKPKKIVYFVFPMFAALMVLLYLTVL